jgi:cellulose synthase operon protein C
LSIRVIVQESDPMAQGLISHRLLQVATLAALSLATGMIPVSAAEDLTADPLATAREHLQKGRYDEAIEAYTAANTGDTALGATIGLARGHLAHGDWEKAEELLAAAVDQHPESSEAVGRLADLHFQRGRYAEALKLAERAIEKDPDELRARLVRARFYSETGKIADAVDEFRQFVRFYNQKQPKDAETLLLVAEGAVEYARARGVSQIFNFVVNELTPDALKSDPDRWEAPFISGSLLLEKYNHGQAVQEFNAALAINPRSADVLAAMGRAEYDQQNFEKAADFADRALKINPRHVDGLLLSADVALAADLAEPARGFVARAKEINPTSQWVLAREAQCDLLENGLPEKSLTPEFLKSGEFAAAQGDREFAKVYRQLLSTNPAPGGFLTSLGEFFEHERRWDAASNCYIRAIEVAPQLSAPRTALGLLKMRTGELGDAREILDSAFKADPYHVRVSNMRKVLGVLEGYEVLTTEHFLIRHATSDKLQAEAIAEYLEQIYPELTKEFGYEPPARTPFELYSAEKGQAAHAWFSARMIGLPWLQTIGASTGMIVALSSPTASREPYNWARVVKHEYSHVLTLQQTGFAIPHWYTEALAVRTEGEVFPDEWRSILIERSESGSLFTLDNLNQGFQRPRNGDDWQCAYCLSRLYSRYMEEKFGTDSLFKLVDAYRRGLKTSAAVVEVFGQSEEEFENGFRKFLDGVIAKLRVGRAPEMPGLAKAESALKAAPDDPHAKANAAWAILGAAPLARAKEAAKLAEESLEQSPAQPVALTVLARIDLRRRKEKDALEKLEKAFDPAMPHPAVVSLLGRVYFEDKDFDNAARVFEAGLKSYGNEHSWTRALAVANLRRDHVEGLAPLMEAVAAHDYNDAGSRFWLLKHAIAEERWQDAVNWGTAVMQIDVKNAAMHRMLGQAYLKLAQTDRARKHLEIAVSLDSDDDEAKKLLESLRKGE